MGDKPHRLDNVDYRARRVYHITMTTVGRRATLGCVVGNPALPPKDYDAPHIFLSPLGRAVEHCLHNIPERYENASILAYQLMPDHLHLVLFITESSDIHLGRIIRGFKQGCNKAARELAAASPPSSTSSSSATSSATVVPSSPSASVVGESAILSQTQQQQLTQQQQQPLQPQQTQHPQPPSTTSIVVFSPDYYETPLSGRDQLQHMIDYVKDNPRRLLIKRQHSALFRPLPLQIALSPSSVPLSPLAVGNTALLSAPKRIAVRISRRISPTALQEALAFILDAANGGAIIISPCVSSGEKTIRDVLLAQHLPYIRIDGEGFGPYYKPPGYEMSAVAAARLLIIAPWPYSTRRIHLTKADFETMNAMAAQLSTVQWNFAPQP